MEVVMLRCIESRERERKEWWRVSGCAAKGSTINQVKGTNCGANLEWLKKGLFRVTKWERRESWFDGSGKSALTCMIERRNRRKREKKKP